MKSAIILALFVLGCSMPQADAATWYVSPDGSDTNSGASWAEARQSLQAAVDLAADGDTVLATNGVYGNGGRAYPDAQSNRVAITRAITLQSVNGPARTTIIGHEASNADSVRCVYLGSNACLMGFTISNGHAKTVIYQGFDPNTRSGGGIRAEFSATVSNCLVTGNVSANKGGAIFGGRLFNCTLRSNVASNFGGGACASDLFNCAIEMNTSFDLGGGVNGCFASNCVISGNTAGSDGGGAYVSLLHSCIISNNYAKFSGGGVGGFLPTSSSLSNCLIIGNTARLYGGGAYSCRLQKCILRNNQADYDGGGSCNGILFNCLLADNSSSNRGGGSASDYRKNVTIVGNVAGISGGGTCDGSTYNSIVMGNFAPSGANYSEGTWDTSCTVPVPDGGFGHVTNDPLFIGVNDFHLQPSSPCIDRGKNNNAVGLSDLEGSVRIANWIVDLGALEYQGAVNPDTDGDGMPNAWEGPRGLDAAVSNSPAADADADGLSDRDEYIADTAPTNAASAWPSVSWAGGAEDNTWQLRIDLTSTARQYSIQVATNLADAPAGWTPFLPASFGNGAALYLNVTNASPQLMYRASVRIPNEP